MRGNLPRQHAEHARHRRRLSAPPAPLLTQPKLYLPVGIQPLGAVLSLTLPPTAPAQRIMAVVQRQQAREACLVAEPVMQTKHADVDLTGEVRPQAPVDLAACPGRSGVSV